MRLASLACCLILSGAARAEQPWEGPAFAGDPKKIAAAAAALKPPVDADGDGLYQEDEIRIDAQ
ncbi:MAG TPA: hypothetical protein VG496_04590, partial [Myxococcales bacterium]|nr:hypothetical protein [Myxococcales bacterium]